MARKISNRYQYSLFHFRLQGIPILLKHTIYEIYYRLKTSLLQLLYLVSLNWNQDFQTNVTPISFRKIIKICKKVLYFFQELYSNTKYNKLIVRHKHIQLYIQLEFEYLLGKIIWIFKCCLRVGNKKEAISLMPYVVLRCCIKLEPSKYIEPSKTYWYNFCCPFLKMCPFELCCLYNE